jgi:hypothetical protein
MRMGNVLAMDMSSWPAKIREILELSPLGNTTGEWEVVETVDSDELVNEHDVLTRHSSLHQANAAAAERFLFGGAYARGVAEKAVGKVELRQGRILLEIETCRADDEVTILWVRQKTDGRLPKEAVDKAFDDWRDGRVSGKL